MSLKCTEALCKIASGATEQKCNIKKGCSIALKLGGVSLFRQIFPQKAIEQKYACLWVINKPKKQNKNHAVIEGKSPSSEGDNLALLVPFPLSAFILAITKSSS